MTWRDRPALPVVAHLMAVQPGQSCRLRPHALPLAVRMRPRTLEGFIGQQHLLAPGSPLRRLAAVEPMSVFLWVPPGVGKTTVAAVVSRQTDSRLE